MTVAQAVTRALGGRWHGHYGMARCPVHQDRDPSLKISNDPNKRDGIDLHCFGGCAWQDVKAWLVRAGLLQDDQPIAAPVRPRPAATVRRPDDDDARKVAADARFIRETLAAARPIAGTPAGAYLSWRLGGRGVPADLDPDVLRFHRR